MSDRLAELRAGGLRLEIGGDGTFRLLDGDSERLRSCAAGVALVGGEQAWSTARGFPDATERPTSSALGSGRLLEATSLVDGLRLRLEAAVYGDHPFATVRLGVTNERASAVPLESLTPLQGEAALPGSPRRWRFYRNGWQGTTPAVSLPALGSELGGLIGPPVHAPEPPPSARGRYFSDDVAALMDVQSRESLLLGFVTARDHLSQVRLDGGRRLHGLCLADGVPLAPGETRWSERLLLNTRGLTTDQLARYGDALGAEMGARASVTPNGWCSWYRYFWNVTEEISLANLRFLADHRDRLPLTYFQIDDGYQADIGDWTTVNEKFPHGMAWMARQIRDAGFSPGLWLAPLFASASSRLYAEHPDWVVRDDEGRPVVAMHNWSQDCYGLDGTNPAVRRWLTDLFREVCDGWGYDYVKTDFLFGGAVKGRRADAALTRAQAYRLGLDAIRRGVGPQRFILGCLGLIGPSVGYFDGARIGPDVAPWWRWLTKEQRESGARPEPYRPDGVPATLANITNTLTRAWMQGRLWANDPDCLLARDANSALTGDEVRTLATAIGLSAGMLFDSDDLTDLSRERLDLASSLLPPLPGPAVVSDVMDRMLPSIMELDVEKPFGNWRLAAAINLEERARDVRLPLPPGRWHAFDFWRRRYLGVHEGAVAIRRLPPHACRALRLTPADGRPALVGSTFHLGQGVHELAGQSYEAGSRTLRLSLQPVALKRGSLFLWAPGDGAWLEIDPGDSATVRRAAGGLWEVRLELTAARTLSLRFP